MPVSRSAAARISRASWTIWTTAPGSRCASSSPSAAGGGAESPPAAPAHTAAMSSVLRPASTASSWRPASAAPTERMFALPARASATHRPSSARTARVVEPPMSSPRTARTWASSGLVYAIYRCYIGIDQSGQARGGHVTTTRVPKYWLVKEQLRGLVDAGDPGTALPTERELAEQLATSRTTVRQAIAELVVEGLLVRTQGSGTYVAEPRLVHIRQLSSFTDDLGEARVGSRVLDVAVEPATGEAALRLGV